MGRKLLFEIEDISRDLDLVVYQLERDPQSDRDSLVDERKRLRRELERLHDRLTDIARGLE